MLLATNYEKKPFLPKVDIAIKNLFNNPADGFFTGKAMDILFHGVSIDCSSSEETTMAVCVQLEDMSAIKRLDETHLAFSILGGVGSVFFLLFSAQVEKCCEISYRHSKTFL